jgi:hypothetical protein
VTAPSRPFLDIAHACRESFTDEIAELIGEKSLPAYRLRCLLLTSRQLSTGGQHRARNLSIRPVPNLPSLPMRRARS